MFHIFEQRHKTNITYFRLHAQNHAKIMTYFVFIRNSVQEKKYLFLINAQFSANLVSFDAKFRAKK